QSLLPHLLQTDPFQNQNFNPNVISGLCIKAVIYFQSEVVISSFWPCGCRCLFMLSQKWRKNREMTHTHTHHTHTHTDTHTPQTCANKDPRASPSTSRTENAHTPHRHMHTTHAHSL